MHADPRLPLSRLQYGSTVDPRAPGVPTGQQ